MEIICWNGGSRLFLEVFRTCHDKELQNCSQSNRARQFIVDQEENETNSFDSHAE